MNPRDMKPAPIAVLTTILSGALALLLLQTPVSAVTYPASIKLAVTYYDFHCNWTCPDFDPWGPTCYPGKKTTKNMVGPVLDANFLPTKGTACQYSWMVEYWFKPVTTVDSTPTYTFTCGCNCASSTPYYCNVFSAQNGELQVSQNTPGSTRYQNITFNDSLTFTRVGTTNYYQYRNISFWPLEGKGYGCEAWCNTAITCNHSVAFTRNSGFTMVLRTQIMYDPTAQQKLVYAGDDDLWLFIDKKLVIDYGGINTHNCFPPSYNSFPDTLRMDSLAAANNLTPYVPYRFDLFYAERQNGGSVIVISTNLIAPVAPPKKLR